MKSIVVLLASLTLIAYAEKPPRGAFLTSQFEEAREAAKAAGKPLVYIETNSESTCPKTQWGTAEAYSELRRDYVMVVQDDSNPESGNIPAMNRAVSETSTKFGRFSPRITVVHPHNLEFISGTDYSTMAKDKRWNRTLSDAVKKALEASATEPAETTKEPEKAAAAQDEKEMRDWTNTEGKTIQAALLANDGITVTLQLKDGRIVDYPLYDLSEETRATLPGN